MADFITTTIGQSITGTNANDNMTFGIQVVDGVAFIATGFLSGAEGDDSFFTLNPQALINGIQTAYGNEGNDNITLGNLFTAYGGKGNDNIQAVGILGQPDIASQQIFGGEGNDTINAGGGNDYIEGNQGFDFIDSGANNDVVWGGKENDTISGGAGSDTLYGNLGGDLINGADGAGAGLGADSIHGGAGNDTISGGVLLISAGLPVGDFLAGNADDTIIGGAGQDLITGGYPGATAGDANNRNIGGTLITSNTQYDDLFRYQDSFAANVGIANIDIINDFQSFGGAVANQRPDKISFATGADAVLAGLNFTASTTYDVNRAVGGPANPVVAPVALGAIATYEALFTAVQAAFAAGAFGAGTTQPVASTNAQLQVYNFTVTAGAGIAAAAPNTILFINNGDNQVSSLNDMIIQGVNVVDGAGSPSTVTDIVFG